jgi:hypothetical protein
MITGRRAFQGTSRISTLAAVVEKDPEPLSKVTSSAPPELERLIARCLRKDINRRSQHMSDVKLALEELREESESGKLAGPSADIHIRSPRWLRSALAIAGVLVAAVVLAWIYRTSFTTQVKGSSPVRLSPDDGHFYLYPAISPDGGFVAYISDRSGREELWLQQVGGGDPIQLTHDSPRLDDPAFFPDGKRILYFTKSPDRRETTIESISTLGGQPTVLIRAGQVADLNPKLSPRRTIHCLLRK